VIGFIVTVNSSFAQNLQSRGRARFRSVQTVQLKMAHISLVAPYSEKISGSGQCQCKCCANFSRTDHK